MAIIAEMPGGADQTTVEDLLLQHQVEQFLYAEALLLDERRFHEWFNLLADDLEYWMPIRTTRARGDEAQEFAKPGEGALFDDDKELMAERVRKLDTGFSWAEDPPSRTRHLVANVRILDRLPRDTYHVGCNFLIYRARLARDEDLWAGRREDTLRRTPGGWRIAKRHIFLDQVSLTSKNLSIFF